jgi:hypothetical protein
VDFVIPAELDKLACVLENMDLAKDTIPCCPGKEGIINLLIKALTFERSITTKLLDFKNPSCKSWFVSLSPNDKD